jgi:predicted esterase
MVSRLRRRADRDSLGATRLITANFTHHYRQFQGKTLSEWSHDQAAPPHLVLGLHGLGANEQQFATLVDLDLAARSIYVGLRAPIDYGREAYSWFDPILDAEHIDYRPTVDRVADFVLELHERTNAGRTATTIIGYSQAAALAVAISALRPDVAANIVLGSAALPPGLVALGHGRPDRALVCVGDKDPFVQAETLAELTNGWEPLVGGLSVRRYDVPHVMSRAMTKDISQWVDTPPRPGAASSAARSDEN